MIMGPSGDGLSKQDSGGGVPAACGAVHLPIVLILLTLILSGCYFRSPSAKYYTLSAMQCPEDSIKAAGAVSRFTVAVGPVILPDMLRRPQIAVRAENHQMVFSEFHKWAGLLKDDIKRVMTENLSGLLAPDGATVFTDDTLMEPDYRVVVNINRFDGRPGDSVCLDAVWTLKDTKRQDSAVFHYHVTEQCPGQTYTDIVRTQSLVIADLSHELAGKINEIVYSKTHGSQTEGSAPADAGK